MKGIKKLTMFALLMASVTASFASLPGEYKNQALVIGDPTNLIKTTYNPKMFTVEKTANGYNFFIEAGKGSPLYQAHTIGNPDSNYIKMLKSKVISSVAKLHIVLATYTYNNTFFSPGDCTPSFMTDTSDYVKLECIKK